MPNHPPFLSLRRAVLGLLVVATLLTTAPLAMAAPKIDDDPPIPTPVIPTPTPTPPPPSNAPDLTVENISYGATGPFSYYIDVRVRNQGNRPAGPFYVRNGTYLSGAYQWVGGLEAGSFINLRFYRSRCESGGTVHVDRFNWVEEFSETNNTRNWLLIC